MKRFFKNVISVLLCAVLALSVCGYGVFGAVSEFLCEENAENYINTVNLSETITDAVEEYAIKYFEPMHSDGLFGFISDGIENVIRSFIRSDECRALADRASRDYTMGFIRFLRCGEGDWVPDRSILSGVSDALVSEIESSIGFGTGDIGKTWLAAIVDGYIDSVLLPQMKSIIPTYEEAAKYIMPGWRLEVFRTGISMYENGKFAVCAVSSAVLMLITGALLSTRGRRLCGFLPVSLGFLSGGIIISFVSEFIPEFTDFSEMADMMLSPAAYRGIAGIISSVTDDIAALVSLRAVVYLITGAVTLIAYVVIRLFLRNNSKKIKE